MTVSKLMKWMPKSLRRSAAPVRKVSLGLQPLEAREVPATHTWMGGVSNNWSDAGNWTGGVPTSNEAGGTIVKIGVVEVSMFQDIAGLEIDQLDFTKAGSSQLTISKQLSLDGSVMANNLVNTAGTNSIIGAAGIKFVGAAPIGAAMTGTLIINSPISGTPGLLLLTGGGVLELTGTNTYAGGTSVSQGTLRLNSATGSALPSTTGTLFIGNGNTNVAEAVVQTSDNSQIPAGVDVTVDTDGVFNLLGKSQTIDNVTMHGGQIATGGGTLILDNNFTADGDALINVGGVGSNGVLNLPTGFHNITVAAGKTLTVKTQITGPGSVLKKGTGELMYNNTISGSPNSYTGFTQVFEGVLSLKNTGGSSAMQGELYIGDGVAPAATVRLDTNFELPDGKFLAINGDGVLDINSNSEVLGNVTMWGGSQIVTGTGSVGPSGNVFVHGLTGTATITGGLDLGPGIHTFSTNKAECTLVVDGAIGVISGNTDLMFAGPGTLELRGSAGTPNTFGAMTVSGGTLLLNDNGNNEAIPDVLTIGDGDASNGVAVVKLLQNTEIANDKSVIVLSDGILDLNGKSDDRPTDNRGRVDPDGRRYARPERRRDRRGLADHVEDRGQPGPRPRRQPHVQCRERSGRDRPAN